MATRWEDVEAGWAWSPFQPTAEAAWDHRRAAHLYRRAAFGGNPGELAAALTAGPLETVDRLIAASEPSAEERRASEALAQTLLATGNPQQLAAWWVYVLLSTRQPLAERLTLFWHGHFATGADKVQDAQAMWRQNQLLRTHALGDFRQLAQQISRDPAMLIYLDSATNRKAHPNENYARELMELFCLGEGNYSEKDVLELARCFTGWEVKQGKFRFNRYQYDAGAKSILGRQDVFPDGAAIDWVVDQPSSPRFIAGKLFRLFVWDEPAPPKTLLAPLAAQLVEHQWQIAPVVRTILSSNLFYSELALARKIRSPVDLAVGLLRSLEGSANTQQLAADLREMGHGLFYPPNVKGWDGGRAWINSSTIVSRANAIGRLLDDGRTRFGGTTLTEYLRSRFQADSDAEIADALMGHLFAMPLEAAPRERLIAVVAAASDPVRKPLDLLRAAAALPEFQLS